LKNGKQRTALHPVEMPAAFLLLTHKMTVTDSSSVHRVEGEVLRACAL